MRRMHAQVAVSTLTLRPVSFAGPERPPREHGMIQAASMADSAHADEMRAAMVGTLLDEGAITSERVAAAFAAVPRHLFAPGETLQAAYAPLGTIMPKRDADGLLLSVLSAPNIQAMMLEPAGIEPGMRVLEVGSGGVNAALIAELAGPGGQVTTVDIDPEVTARARACLDAAGYGQVRVVLADAEHGAPDGAPYDRIIVTAGAWDIPPSWISQLAPDGRLVVPLRLRGLTRTVTFEPDSAGLVSLHYQLAAFVPFQGDGAHHDRKVMLRNGIVVHTDNPTLRIDAAALNAALDAPRLEVWTGARYDFPDEVSLFTTMNAPGVVQLHASQQMIDAGIVGRWALRGIPAMITADSIAYRMARQVSDDPAGYESGVIAHGPHAESLAAQYADLLRRWARDYCRRGAALFRFLPGGSASDTPPPGAIAVLKRHGLLTVTWP
jgi:protein-L-isoaspartate(D-aspartate) O-methyltransferase